MNSKNISNEENITQSKSKIIFDNLKSDYFLLKLFNIMKKNKSLQIMKYNKKQQKRLNININDYKDYSQLYSPIEIELRLLIIISPVHSYFYLMKIKNIIIFILIIPTKK